MSTTTINGRPETLPDDPDALLVDVIRDRCGLTGTKLVCGSGVCGACTVLLDGAPVVSCLLPAQAAGGKSLTTIEGIGGDKLHPIQKAFMAHDALQCGFCTPGFVVEAVAFHDRWRAARGTAAPSREEIAAALSGHTGAAVNSTIAALARLIYPAEAKELVDYDVLSNLPPGAPFRGPGGPPMAFAIEQAVDEAALRMNVDPLVLRKRWDPDPNRQRLYDWALGLDVWRNRKPASVQRGRYRRGVGVATGYWLYLWQPGSSVELAVKGGRLVASCAVQDIGTGTRSVLANIVAREFSLEPQDVEIRIGHSNLPEGPGSGGSRVTSSIVPSTLLAIEKLKAEIQRSAARPPLPGSNAPWRELIAASPDLAVTAERPKDAKPAAGIASPLRQAGLMGIVFGWMLKFFNNIVVGAGVPSSVQVMEVEVDTWLGHVRVLNAWTGLAIGKLAAPALAHSQAAGAVIQGIGYALYEARETDPLTGHVLSGSMEDYRIPGIADMPRLDVHFDEAGFDHVPGGSVGIGEVSTVPTSPAIANAIRDAIGVRLTEIPFRPDRLVAALKGRDAA